MENRAVEFGHQESRLMTQKIESLLNPFVSWKIWRLTRVLVERNHDWAQVMLIALPAIVITFKPLSCWKRFHEYFCTWTLILLVGQPPIRLFFSEDVSVLPFVKCTMNNCESEEIVEPANIAISNLLPTKSRTLYDIAYNRFKKVVR
ncbi:hypothetical protein NQ317_015972 [Molorchus minor]|uniref:Uncharacterized protein n=1 Tax=Molorchus minor TaxID=1323400 RepID=A0ABQ9JUD3_9CUCU|nr:hypothetical protein NQ317_015972 [Molorchus minor]